jgi:uncharacterized membrane protein
MDKKFYLLFILSLFGLLFSGYMSSVKFFTQTCVFNEPCPYFFGFPACYFGFIIFLSLFIFSSLLLFKKIHKRKGLKFIMLISFVGIIFSGYFTLFEIPVLVDKGIRAYVFGLPTCALGLIFYILIYCTAIISYRKQHLKLP